MNTSMRLVLCLLGLSTTLSLSSCQSTATPVAKIAAPAVVAPSDTASMSAKQQEYEQMLQEWKSLKPGLTRMLAIEEEMNQLIGQLALLAKVTENQIASVTPVPVAPTITSAPILNAPVVNEPALSESTYVSAPSAPVKLAIAAPTPALVSAPAPTSIPAPAVNDREATNVETTKSETSNTETANTDSANYSLQVASLTELKLLPKKWQEMQRSHPQLLADLTPNFQAIKVNNTTYYRLKVGGFNTAQDANKKCSELITAGISCLPAKYSESNFAQI